MTTWFTDEQKRLTEFHVDRDGRFPLPTRVFSNGEYLPPKQTQEQREVEQVIVRMADELAPEAGLERRSFLRSSLGLAASFVAMNTVYGEMFSVAAAEIMDSEASAERARTYADQFIFDGHLHFVHDEYDFAGLLGLRKRGAAIGNEALIGKPVTFADFQFDNFVNEVFLDSDTTVGIISTATADDPKNVFLDNDQMRDGAARMNRLAGSKRLLSHATFEPGKPGWLDQVDRVIETMRPASWKGYTVGDPLSASNFPYRLDDEKLMYPFYEKIQRAGINTVCIHKGLLPTDYEESFRSTWRHAMVDDVPKAAKDWPGINFAIYHSALKPVDIPPAEHLARFERTGRIDWVSDLAEIPGRHGVSNVYADLGTTFATSVITHPRHAAALLGMLIKGLGADKVLWGSDSVWYGSPQWQIEALRRFEIPDDLQRRHGYAPLGEGRGAVKAGILGLNSARLYGFSPAEQTVAHYAGDRLSEYRRRYRAAGAIPSNTAYGFIRPEDG